MASLPGYQFLGKSRGERYIDPSGNEISKREYRNRQLQQAGVAGSLSEREYSTQRWTAKRSHKASTRVKQYEADVKDYARTKGVSEREARSYDSQLSQAIARLKSEGRSTDPDSALGDLLVLLGRREEDDEHDIGDTDTKPYGG